MFLRGSVCVHHESVRLLDLSNNDNFGVIPATLSKLVALKFVHLFCVGFILSLPPSPLYLLS
jgi:hypothetical protein